MSKNNLTMNILNIESHLILNVESHLIFLHFLNRTLQQNNTDNETN